MGSGFSIVLLVLIAVAAGGAALWSQVAERRRREQLWTWARASGLSFDPGRQPRMDHEMPVFPCLRQGSNRYAYNVMRGQRAGRGVSAFDYHYETHSTDSNGRQQTHHHNFSAVALRTDLPLRPLKLRPEGLLDKVTEFFGWDDIDFESAEFSRTFYVTASDRRWAFDVFHQATMEFLLASPRFRLEMCGPWMLVWRDRRFPPHDFGAALGVAEGIVERLPGHVLRELKGVDG